MNESRNCLFVCRGFFSVASVVLLHNMQLILVRFAWCCAVVRFHSASSISLTRETARYHNINDDGSNMDYIV